MKNKKLFVIGILALALIAVLAGLVWHMTHYVMVDFTFYAKNAKSLDLREEEISLAHFDKLHRQLPDCEIRWSVPFQETFYDSSITELTVEKLTETDIERMAYFTQLEKLNAQMCTDYPQLLQAREAYPELEMSYQIPLGGGLYEQDTVTVELGSFAEEEFALLPCLPKLET